MSWSNNTLLEHNTFSYNNVGKFSNNWSAAGTKIAVNCKNLKARSNIIERNYTTGFWMDAEVNDAQVYGNISRNNDGLGIFFEISRGAHIAYNLLVSNGVGLIVSNSSRAEVWNNTFVENGTALLVKGGGRVKSRDAAGKTTLYPSGENVVKNNLFFDSRKDAGKLFVNGLAWIARSDAFLEAMDFNGYVRRAGADPSLIGWTTVPGFSVPGGPRIGEQTPRYTTLEAFQTDPTSAPFERHSLAFDGDVPLFVDANNLNPRARDYRLMPNSADEWARQIRGSGARYVVFTTKHHHDFWW